MRSKAAWCWLVALYTVIFGAVAMLASVDKALTKMFSVHDCQLIVHSASGWVMATSAGTFLVMILVVMFTTIIHAKKAAKVSVDLVRLLRSVFLGALLPFVWSGSDPWTWTPLVVLAMAVALTVDRRLLAKDCPWQTWPLLALSVAISGVLFLNCL